MSELSHRSVNTACKFLSRVGGGKPGSEGKKTPSVFSAGMLMAALTKGRVTHDLEVLCCFWICWLISLILNLWSH